MKYLLEILKIIDGAIHSDKNKVIAYVGQLAEKLEAEGDARSASRLRQAISRNHSSELSFANFAPNGHVPVDSESRLSLADEEILDVAEVEVFLESDIRKTVEEFLIYINAADHLLAAGVGISPSLIIFGPPGCGKTELARYMAARLELPLLTARTDSLISSYLGSTAKNLRMLFEHSMARPCVLFLDEFDAVAKLRDDRHELGELKRVVVSLLQNIDAMDNKTVLIAATNHEHLLDSAIWRRFAYKVHMMPPGFEVRLKLFGKYLGHFSDKKEINSFSSVAEGMSGSDIRLVAENAIRRAILEQKDKIESDEIFSRILSLRMPQHENSGALIKDRLREARNLNPKVFTVRRLSRLFGISTGQVSTLLREKG